MSLWRAGAFLGRGAVRAAEIAIIVLLISGVARAQSANLLTNGGFDGSLAGWTNPSPSYVSASHATSDASGNSASGSALVTVVGPPSPPPGCAPNCWVSTDALTQKVPVVGGGTYTLTASILANVGRGMALVSWEDAAGAFIGNNLYSISPFPLPGQPWTTGSWTGTAPANAANAVIHLDIETWPASGASAYFDSVFFVGAPGQAPQISSFAATPPVIAAGQTTTLSWSTTGASSVTIDNGVGAVALSGVATVKPTAITTYTLTAMSPSGPSVTAQATVQVISNAVLTITGNPTGMTQLANAGGGIDRVAVTNFGGAAANVTVALTGNFFTVSPMAFALPAGATQTVTLTGTPQAAGVYDGAIQFTDPTNSADTASVKVRLLSAAVSGTGGHASTTTPRVDLSAPAGTTASGSMSFRNDGSGVLQGIAVSDKPWVIPESGLISIAPGQTRSVSFSIDPSMLGSGAAGTQSATLYLTYLVGAAGKRAGPNDSGANTNNAQGSLNYTPSISLTSGPVPPLGQQIAYFIPGILHAGPTLSDFIATNRTGAAISAGSVLFIQPNVPPASAAVSATLGSVPGGATFRYSDIVGQLFKIQSSQVGTLQIRDADKLAVAAAIATPTQLGTFLGSVKAFRSDRASAQNKPIYLVGIRNDATATTSLYIQEVSGTDTSVKTDFLDASGNTVSTRTDSVSGSSLLTVPSPATPAGAVVAVVTSTGAGSIVARAFLRYVSTGDMTDVVDWNAYNGGPAPASQVIPYVARNVQTASAGHPGSAMTTELDIMNTSAATPLVATLEYRAPAGCIPDANTLCLNGSRFAVTAQWQTNDGTSGQGTAVALSSDTGYFWFFGPTSVEVIVKVLNGCGLNSNYWVFAGGLTNVNVVLTIRDTKTGMVKTYTNPANTAFQPIQDTGAFAACASSLNSPLSLAEGGTSVETWVASQSSPQPSIATTSYAGAQSTTSATLGPASTCVQDTSTLCLSGSRFAVTAQWRTTDGNSGQGTAVPLTSDTGYFWFFGSSSVEVVIKVLNGCGLNSNYWVFAGGLTNVNVVMTIRDTNTGTVKTYTNSPNTAFQPIQDTAAFAVCGVGIKGAFASGSMPSYAPEPFPHNPTLTFASPSPSHVPAPNAVTVMVPPLQTIAYTDVLTNLGITDASAGALVLTTTSGSPALTALLNETVDGIGTFSTSLPVAAEAIGKGSKREYGGLEDSDPGKVAAKTPNTYSNRFSLMETAGKSAVVRVTLYYYSTSGSTSEVPPPPRDYSLSPNTTTSLKDLVREFVGTHRDDLKDLHDVRVDFQVIDGDGTVIPYVVTTESATGDQIVRSSKF